MKLESWGGYAGKDVQVKGSFSDTKSSKESKREHLETLSRTSRDKETLASSSRFPSLLRVSLTGETMTGESEA